MKLLASTVIALTLLGAGVSAFGEPIVTELGTVKTAILLTPEFEVDTSEFSETGEIILDVKFHNPTTSRYGIDWVFENPSADGVNPDPVEFYEKYEDERRFYIYLNNENGDRLDIESMTVTSEDDFILPHGVTEKYDDRFVVEALDIDSLVQSYGSGQKIETQLRLESSELVAEKDYQLEYIPHHQHL